MGPILCNYYVTYRCNSRCVYCDFGNLEKYRHSPLANLADVRTNLQALKGLGVRFIDFTGGEPLLHPHLPEMLREAKRLRFATSLTTNTLLYPKRANELRGLVNLLHFSLDSLDPAEYHRLRGVPGLEKVIESLDIAQRLREQPDVLFTVTNENYRAIDALSLFAAQRQVMLIVNPLFSAFGHAALKPEVLDHIEQFRHRPFVYMNLALHRLIRAGGNDIRHPRCRAVSSTVVISPDNYLLLPCYHRHASRLPINGDLLRVWRSAGVREARRNEGRHRFCQGCTINCYFDPSFVFGFDRYFWDSLRAKVKYTREKYLRVPAREVYSLLVTLLG